MKRYIVTGIIFILCLLISGCGKREARHYELALRYKESGDYDKAIGELQAAIKINPRFEKAYNQLGVLYGRVALYDKAAEQFKKAVEINPEFATAHYNLGVLYQSHLNRPADAVSAYRRYLALAPGGQKTESVKRIIQSLVQDASVRSALGDSAEELQLVAKGFEEKGEYEKAVEAYGKAVAKEPRSASRAHLQMAKIYEEKIDKPAEALRQYQAYLDTNINAPDAAEVMANVARLRGKVAPAPTPAVAVSDAIAQAERLLKEKDAARAVEILLKARDASPDDDRVHDLLAEAYASSGDLRGAESEYEWLKSHQRDFAYAKELVATYRSLGEESLKADKYSEAEERFLKALDLSPQDGALHWGLARALAGGDKFQRALGEASIARTLLPGEVSDSSIAELHLSRARFLMSQGQYDSAAGALEEAKRLRPELDVSREMTDLSEGQARAAQREGNLGVAEQGYLRALKLDPKRIALRAELATVYEQLGRYDKALVELEKVAEGGEDGASAYKEMARIYETYKGDNAKATAYYRKYLGAKPKAEDAKSIEKKLKTAEHEKEQIVHYEQEVERKPSSAPNYYNLAILLQRQDKYREAIDAYRKALALDPANAQIHFNLAYSYDRLKMYEEAIVEYRKAIQCKPDYLKAYSNLAAIYKDKGWYGKAIAMFEKALTINPSYAHAHLGLGSIYAEGLKDRQKAIVHYKQYLRLQPDGPYAPQVRAWIGGKV